MTAPDPFASAPTPPPAPEPEQEPDEAQTEAEGAFDAPPEEAKPAPKSRAKASTTKAATAAPVVVNNAEGKVVLTFKGGANFADPWIVVHASDLAEAKRYVTEDAGEFLELMTRVQNAAQHFASLSPAKPDTASSGGGDNRQSSAPKAATQAPNGESRSCKHGEMQYRTGAKNGRTWRAFMCPTPKGTADQCKAEFLRDND